MENSPEDIRLQIEASEGIIEEALSDGHEIDLSARDLLDYMGILGLSFVRGTAASDAYMQTLIDREG